MRLKSLLIGVLLAPTAAMATGQVGPWNDTAPSEPRPWDVCHVVEKGGTCQGGNGVVKHTLSGAENEVRLWCRDTDAVYQGGHYMIKLTNDKTGEVREYLCSDVRQQMHG